MKLQRTLLQFSKVDILGASRTARTLVLPRSNLLLLINHTSIRLVNSSCLPYPSSTLPPHPAAMFMYHLLRKWNNRCRRAFVVGAHFPSLWPRLKQSSYFSVSHFVRFLVCRNSFRSYQRWKRSNYFSRLSRKPIFHRQKDINRFIT